MLKNYWKISIALGCLMVVVLIIFLQTGVEEIDSKVNLNDQVISSNNDLFFDQQLFDYGIRSVKNDRNIQEEIKGVIVPHHLLASHIIADTLHEILRPEIKKVIIIGPDHWEKNSGSISTSDYDWETPFGNIISNNDIINSLNNADYINIESNVLKNEHSIGGLIPFISYYSSDIEIVPLVISQKITEEEIDDIVERLYELSQDESVAIVVSVDFSHYLTSTEAERNDKISLQVIENKDYDELLGFNNDYVDSPQSLVIFLKTLDHLEMDNLKVLHNTTSGKMMNDESIKEVTSYFGIIFW